MVAICSIVRTALSCLLNTYQRVQVSHRGKYSIERLLALQEYSQSASTLRVLLVCVLTPLPMIIIALAIETIPLQDPSAGWRANTGMWIRTALASLVAIVTIVNLMRLLVPGVGIRPVHVAVMSIVTSVVYTVVAITVAAFWVYPIPFTIIVMNVPVLIAVAVTYFAVVGRCSIQRIRRLKINRMMLERFAWFFGAQALLSVVYPAYSVMFVRLAASGYELSALMVLPVIRMVMCNLVAFCTSHLEDLIPTAVIFTLELFNLLYLSASIQRVSSIYSMLAILVIDAGHVLFALHNLRTELSDLVTASSEIALVTKDVQVSSPNVLFDVVNRATAKVSLTSTMDQFSKIRLRSSVQHKLSKGTKRRLQAMSQRGSYATTSFTHARSLRTLGQERPLTWNASVVPLMPIPANHQVNTIVGLPAIDESPVVNLATPHQSPDMNQATLASSADWLQQLDRSLHLAFAIEYIALVEYLESVIPLLYTVFASLLMKLPSKAYHMELTGITDASLHRSINNTLLYGLMEGLSFVVLTAVLWRGARLNALHVVAFVLETHMQLIQGMLVMWMLVTQEFQVEHWGSDFTFEFAWMNRTQHSAGID